MSRSVESGSVFFTCPMMNAKTIGSSERNMHFSPKVTVVDVISTRYRSETESKGGDRPISWDERVEGIDTIRAAGGEVLRLKSSAMQSPPKPGWVLVVTGGCDVEGYTWTLYGITPQH